MSDNFPDGVTLKKHVNEELNISESVFRLLSLISENFIPETQERVAVFTGERLSDGVVVILKLRVQLDPEPIAPEDREGTLLMSQRSFRNESILLQHCKIIPHIPTYFGSENLIQGPNWPFPGGYLFALVMSKAPGVPVTKIPDLTEVELTYIRKELALTLESMRQQGFYYREAAAEQLFFDRRPVMIITLTGFSDCPTGTPPEDEAPITVDDDEVLEFGLWD